LEESKTIVSVIALPVFLLSLLAAARLMEISRRTALIFTFELFSGTFLVSRILGIDYMRFLKLTLATLSLTLVISVPLCLLAFLFMP